MRASSARNVEARRTRAGLEACLRGGLAYERSEAGPHMDVYSARDVQASRTHAGPEARLRGGPAPERSEGGWAAAEVAAGHVRGGGHGPEVPWERSECGAGGTCPDGADQVREV